MKKFLTYILFVFLVVTSANVFAQPPAPGNDDCGGATTLTVGATCSFTGTNNNNSTGSTGVPAPGCASYSTQDVWFKVTVPASGHLIFDTSPNQITDGGMAIYSGTCASLTLIECDDDDSNNGAMPMIDRPGLTPGTTIYIRFWEFGGGEGTFNICVYDGCPSCSGTPTGGTANTSSSSICSGSVNLSVTGGTTGCGLTYQWQSSPNNSTWTNIAGATSATYTATPSSTTYYRRIITCTASSQSANSSSVLVTIAGTPANDDCSSAIALTVNTSTTCTIITAGTVECATTSSQSTSACGGTEDDDVWFSFVATATSQNVSLQNIVGSDTDMYHSVWTGTCPSLTLVSGTCEDFDSQTVTGLTIGQTYFVRVYTWTSTGNQNTDFNICIANPCPTCSGTPAGGTSSASVTAVCGGSTNLSVTGSVTGCSYAYQWQSSTNNSTWTNIAGATSETYTGTPSADIYYRRIVTCAATGNSGTSSSTFIDYVSAPANDDCSGATVVPVNPTQTCTLVTAGTVNCATPSSQATAGCGGTDDDDVWFQFTATSTVHEISLLNIAGSVTNMYHSVWTGTCPSIGLQPGTCSDNNSQIVSGLTVGSVYFIRVYTYTSTGGQNTSFNVCVGTPPPPPANDECSGAVALNVSSSTTCNTGVNGTVESATGSPQASGGCSGTDDDDVWYSFVATASSQTITLSNVTGSNTDMYHSLWTGTCPNLNIVSGTCEDFDSQTVTGLTVGQTYYVRVYTYTSTYGQNTDFTICITNPCPSCNNNPSGGNSSATLGTVCGNSTTLSVTGSVTGCAYSYQWQYSLDNTNWSDIPGATGETYVATPNADIYYRRIVTCPNNSNSNTSSATFIDVTPGPSNDEPCTASALTVGTSCTFNTYTNTCATNSVTTVGAPTPSCTTYGGGDVWFTVTVPSGGSLTFDSDEGVITDLGMAIYSGTCTSLTQIACDDDGSTNGAMSYIAATGLTPGSTIWVRCWEYGGDNNGTFSLCVYDPCPPCSGSPTAGTASANPAITNCGSPNTTLSLAGGSSGCGFSYQWQSSPDDVTWTSISGATSATYTTPVTNDTYFRCIISCIASSQSSTSNSVLVTTEIANACSFTISTPAYSPDAAFTAGTLLTFPDDQMSNVIPIGFSFCFMGTNYTSCLVSSNSFISFNTATAGQYSAWVTVPIPTAVPDEALNSIMFPWHDIDPSVGVASDIRYLTSGVAPNRKFIVNFSLTPMYSFACNSMTYTGQVVLNETTNIIETYIQTKVICSSWNSGNAVHGINGPDGCSGVVVSGRNNTQWTATNDAKMFTPTGCCSQPLSAEIILFDGKQIEKNLNEVYWTSSTETNLDKYILEKSENGLDFEYFKEMKAVGNTSYSTNYTTSDDLPFEKITYYRIRQVDLNGAYEYSNTISILNSAWDGFDVYNLFPNPSEGLVNAEIYATQDIEFTLEIKDISGRTVRTTEHELQFGTNMMNFDLTTFESGIYFFNFISKSNGKVTSLRYIKE